MKRQTVLLVEDDPLDVELIRLEFDRPDSPFSLFSVPRGQEAIRYLQREGQYADPERFPKPVVILLDLDLPHMDGFQVLRWMQKQPAAEMPPVIALS